MRQLSELIKEQTLDNVHVARWSSNLNLCGGNITYQDLLQHLGVAFQGDDDEANVLAESYSQRQYSKESEEAFADDFQLLARKVISKKPDFRVNLDCYHEATVCQSVIQSQQCIYSQGITVANAKCVIHPV